MPSLIARTMNLFTRRTMDKTSTDSLLVEAFLNTDLRDFKNELEQHWPKATANLRLIGGDELLDELDETLYDVHQTVHVILKDCIEATVNIEEITRESLTDVYGEINIANSVFTAGEILQKLDPVLFKEAVQEELEHHEYTASEDWNSNVVTPLRELINKYPVLEKPLDAVIEAFKQDLKKTALKLDSKIDLDAICA